MLAYFINIIFMIYSCLIMGQILILFSSNKNQQNMWFLGMFITK